MLGRRLGDGGQYVQVIPGLDLVVVLTTSAEVPESQSRTLRLWARLQG